MNNSNHLKSISSNPQLKEGWWCKISMNNRVSKELANTITIVMRPVPKNEMFIYMIDIPCWYYCHSSMKIQQLTDNTTKELESWYYQLSLGFTFNKENFSMKNDFCLQCSKECNELLSQW